MPAKLTAAQRRMLIASEPDDRTGEEGCGVELSTGIDYATARALKRRGLGELTGPGGALAGMYWSNAAGLAAREELIDAEYQQSVADRKAAAAFRDYLDDC
jgi:hypothetical protein